MQKLIFLIIIGIGVPGYAEPCSDLVGSEDAPAHTRTDRGVIQERDIAARRILINGYSYLVGNSFKTPVTLFGTSAGAYELLNTGMKVEVDYFDLGDQGRVAVRIAEIHPGEQVEF